MKLVALGLSWILAIPNAKHIVIAKNHSEKFSVDIGKVTEFLSPGYGVNVIRRCMLTVMFGLDADRKHSRNVAKYFVGSNVCFKHYFKNNFWDISELERGGMHELHENQQCFIRTLFF